MRYCVALGLVALACGGEAATSKFAAVGGSSGDEAGSAGAQSFGSKTSGGTKSVAGDASSAGKPSGGSAGSLSAAGTGDVGGGASGASMGDAGASGASAGDAGAGGEGGSPPAPDDTGCVERPWTGNNGDLSEKVPGYDCSSCTTGSALGYTTPAFCGTVQNCNGAVFVADDLGPDSFVLLPPGSAQGAGCEEQGCDDGGQIPSHFPGYVEQLRIVLPAEEEPWRVEVDEHRLVINRSSLEACDAPATCYASGSYRVLSVVVKPDAPRGWVRIRELQGQCE